MWSGLYHGSCIDPTLQSHTLDLTSGLSFLRLVVPIQLLVKDTILSHFLHFILHFHRILLHMVRHAWLEIKFGIH